ncbi:hypothetical protein POV27_03500 [Aureisphaera galaxeae]|uniref:hypothetical protein n=1 Tax=Aureisphaera galaxeae TaxID=1538023 RepID=UPI002350B9CB|nr:hypothetical protein [Aureisphaera galaxeae]MDC8003099.1 hypothetical protein [Aureisphaera galaxeae]
MRNKHLSLLEEMNDKLDRLLESKPDSDIRQIEEAAEEGIPKKQGTDDTDISEDETETHDQASASNLRVGNLEDTISSLEKPFLDSYQYNENEMEYFNEQKEQFSNAKYKFNKWVDYIHVLANTFDNEIVYGFGELLEKEEYNIQKSKRVFFLPLHTKEEDNQILFEDFGKELMSVKEVPSNEIAYSYGNASVRRTAELDYSLSSIGPTSLVNSFAKEVLNNTFSLSFKQLDRSRKELILLLSKTIGSQKLLQTELQHPSPIGQTPIESKVVQKASDSWSTNNVKTIKEIESASESIFNAYKEYLKRLFKVYNEVQNSHKNFGLKTSSITEEEQDFIEAWDALFKEITHLFLTYLKNVLHICPIDCNRGDTYNYHFHLPQGGGEPDDELENDTIKNVETTGFRLMGDYQAYTPMSEIIPADPKELNPQYILLQTEVTVVLNKSKTS